MSQAAARLFFLLWLAVLYSCGTREDERRAQDLAGSAAADSSAAPGSAGKEEKRAAGAVPVETARAHRGEISSYLLFNSTVETEDAVEIHAQVSGLVEAVNAEEGDHVAAGDTLVRLDDHQARLDYLESEVDLRHLEAGFERIREMFRRRLISDQEYEDKQFQLEQARLRRRKAQLKLEYTAIRAPFAGVITARQVQVGSRVDPGKKLYDLVKLGDMIARVFVPGQYLRAIETGQRALVRSDFLPDMRFAGAVKRISPVVDPKSGTFKVTIGLEDRWNYLRPGIFVEVQIVTATHPNAVLVPKEAVVYEGGDRYLFVVADSIATRVNLEAGFENSRVVEVLSGVAAGSHIIVVGQQGLKDGVRVRVVNSAEESDEAVARKGNGDKG